MQEAAAAQRPLRPRGGTGAAATGEAAGAAEGAHGAREAAATTGPPAAGAARSQALPHPALLHGPHSPDGRRPLGRHSPDGRCPARHSPGGRCPPGRRCSGAGWCKIIGDWAWDEPPVPLAVLREVTSAVHAIGGKVSVHAQTAAGCANAVAAGVDSLEHGMHLDPGLLDQMAAQGTALVPTLNAFAAGAFRVRAGDPGPRRDSYLAGWAAMPPTAGPRMRRGSRCWPAPIRTRAGPSPRKWSG